MKKTIKYLDNDGNYQYATVKDAGDLDKLKTKAKEDLVSAINELATNGIAAGGNIDEINNKVDQIQQQANQNADALNMSDQERQEMQQQIAQMQAEVQAKVAEMQKLAEEQNRKLQEASVELKKKADAIDVQKMQQDNAEALKNSAKALEDSLAATNEDLQKTADHLNEMEIQAGVVETSVKELQNGFESKVSSADFNEARTKLQEQETMVRQLNNELSTKASNNELDMVTQRVQKAESDIQQNAQGIKASVTRETMYKEMDDFAKYRENRLKYSRDFSNDWSLNGNDIIDDDHLFDTQHDVKSVSIRNGAYLTQTTDLDTDDMSKTFTLAMWVEKGKKPRAWYGSAELTNMKVKEDKGDYQRVYWTFVPTIVKQDIRITGDTSTQGNLIISEPKLEQSNRPSAWSTNTGDQYATTEKLAHDLKLTADKLESTITKQSEFSDRQQQDESRITQTEHGVEVANQTIVAKTDGLRQEFDGKIDATSKSLTTEYQSFTNRALGQMADGGANLILNSSFGSLKNSFDKWTNVNPKARIVTDDNGLKWVKLEQSGLTADSPIGLTSNLFRVKKGIVTVALDIRTDNAGSIDNDNIVILESYSADQKRVFTKNLGFGDFKIARETLTDRASHRITYKYNQTRDDTQYMAVHIMLPKNGILYATNVLARTIANGEDSGEYAPNDADLREQVVQQRTRIEQNDQAIALKADQTKVTQDIDAAKSSLSGAISRVEQRAANLEVKADGITSSVSTLSKTVDGISVGGTNLLLNTKDFTGDWYQLGSASLQDLDGRKVIHAWADWGSYRTRQVIQLEQNTDYTISADIRSLDGNSSDNTVTIYGVLDGKFTKLGDLHTNGKLSSKQQRFSTVWHNTSAGQLTTFRLEGHGGWGSVHGSIYISHIKLEKGNKPTDWSPAPEDTDSSISALESRASKLEQTDSEIKASVTSVTNDLKNGRGSIKEGVLSMTDDHFSTKFSSINGKIDGISVGGRNYLRNSDKSTSGWAQDLGTMPNEVLNSLAGKTITVSADVEWSNFVRASDVQNRLGFEMAVHRSDGKDQWFGAWVSPTTPNGKERVSTTFDVPAGLTYTVSNNGQNGYVGIKGTGTVSHAKIEIGNKPTDWSPAPEDTDSNISSLQSRTSKLEQTDSEIKASVTSVTNDLKNGRGSIKEGVLSMTDDHLETKFSSINGKIDGISVGGTNLVTGTSDDLENKTSSGWYYLMSHADNANFDLANYKGQVITIRAWIEKPSVDSRLQMWTNTNNGLANGTVVKAGQSGYSTITGWTVPDTFSSWHLVYGNGGAITFGIKKLKIEHGNKPTDWSPQVSDLKLGGDNLLPNSGKMYVLADYSANSMTTRTTTTGERYDGENYKRITGEVLPKNDVYITLGKTGETYTQSIEVETDGFPKNSIVVSWFANNNVGHQYRPIHIDKLGKNTYRLWSTYSQTKDDLSIRVIDFSNFELVGGSYIEFRHPKLERGNRPTAWTPSIDDQNGTGANILKNSSTPHASAKSSKWEDGGWRGAGHGGSKKEIREYSDSIVGHVYGLHIESGDDSTDVDYAQDTVPFKIGQVYTISAYACGRGTVFLEAGPGANGVWHMYTEKVGTSWKKFSYSFIADADHMNVYFGAKEANSVIDIVGMKLEYGSQATTYNTGGWEVSVNGLKSEFARLDGNTLKYSSMEQTADGFKFTVGSGNNQKVIDLNTRDNILTGTSSNWRRIPLHSSQNTWWNVNTATTRTPSMIQFPAGTQFVYSIDIKNTTNKGIKAETIWVDPNGSRISDSGRQGATIKPGATGTSIVTVPPRPGNGAYLETNVVSEDGRATGEQEVQLRNEKLEVGDNPTPWCASSQDRSGNLLTGTSNFDGFNVNSGNAVRDNWVDSNGNAAIKQLGAWNGYTKAIWLPRGTYTFSGYVYIQGSDLVSIYTDWKRDRDSQAAIIFNQWANLPNVQNKWQKFVFQFEVSEAGNVYPRLESTNNNTIIHIGSYKLEKGLHNDAEWSDNPKTIESKTTNLQKGLSTAQATIEQNSKSIALKVDTGKIINTINNSTEGIHISGNKIDIQSLKSSINLDNGDVKINGDRISLTTNNAKTLAGQINDNNSGITISGKHISINGDTDISGTLKVPEVVLQGKYGSILMNSSNGVIIKNDMAGSDKMVQIGYGTIYLGTANKAGFYNLITENQYEYYNKSKRIGAIGQNHLQGNENIRGMMLFSDSGAGQKDNESPKYLAIGFTGNNYSSIQTQVRINNQDYIDENSAGFLYRKGIHFEDDVFVESSMHVRGQVINLSGSALSLDGVSNIPVFGWVSWSKWNNIKHWAIVDPDGMAGYAMSGDGAPILFGRGTTFGIQWGGTETDGNSKTGTISNHGI